METSDEPHALGIASPAPGENVKSQKIAVVGGGRERSRHRQTSCAPASTSPSSSNGRRMPRRCGRTGFGSSCRTRLWSHLFALCTVAVLEDWMKGRRGEGEDINGLRRAGAAPPRPPRARERGADRNRRQDRERSVVRLAFERRPPEVGARGRGKSLQMTRRGGARGGRTRWPGLRTQSS